MRGFFVLTNFSIYIKMNKFTRGGVKFSDIFKRKQNPRDSFETSRGYRASKFHIGRGWPGIRFSWMAGIGGLFVLPNMVVEIPYRDIPKAYLRKWRKRAQKRSFKISGVPKQMAVNAMPTSLPSSKADLKRGPDKNVLSLKEFAASLGIVPDSTAAGPVQPQSGLSEEERAAIRERCLVICNESSDWHLGIKASKENAHIKAGYREDMGDNIEHPRFF